MRTLLKRFLEADAGATAVEYGLIAAGIALVVVAAAATVGNGIITTLTRISTALQ